MPASEKGPSVRRAFIAIWRTLAHDFSGSYHPELHYMRGPGPKWREKHGDAAVEGIDLAPLTGATA